MGLVLEFEMWRHFDRKQKTEIKIVYFVQLCLIALIVCDCMVYRDTKFLIFKTKQAAKVSRVDRDIPMSSSSHPQDILSHLIQSDPICSNLIQSDPI